MYRFPLYTYKDIKEFNLLSEELSKNGESIYDFKFQETGNLLEEYSGKTIDISNLVLYLTHYTQDIYSASLNFENLDETNKIIIKDTLIDYALDMFRLIFDQAVALYPVKEDENILINEITPLSRRCLYTYTGEELDELIKYLNKENIPFINFSKLNNKLNEELYKYTIQESAHAIIDLTSVVLAMDNNPNLIYFLEQYLNTIDNYNVVIKKDIADKALELLRLTLSHTEKINKLLPEIIQKKEQTLIVTSEEDKLVRVTDLKIEGIETLLDQINFKLFGHQKFKDRFAEAIKEFIFLNKIKEKNIFSIFLLGSTGVGKTEFARIIKNNLNKSTSLAKINFGNYSSQDSLNSLIGSPRGYIGSEEGELSVKLEKSNAGIVVCDEFEKASKPIYNFFLELLEDGTYTDSQSREYNLDGYLIVFTSNLDEQNFYKVIPEELQSRLDLVCEFEKLTISEKQEFVNDYINRVSQKVKMYGGQSFTEEDINQIKNINVESVDCF
ncbi:AAA family ATPase [Siminovitchia sp. 179-K 8D1 HS]|uniref:AAA family ATPase n=1 Tax=Siminovitchia sp. 179-K 8D1 HS TaxID=3142385 RepID=UPI0039A10F54